MNTEVKKALEASLSHWEDNRIICPSYGGPAWFWENCLASKCALCYVFIKPGRGGRRCEGCPLDDGERGECCVEWQEMFRRAKDLLPLKGDVDAMIRRLERELI